MTGKGRYRDDFSAPPEPHRAPTSIGSRVLQTMHQGRMRTVVIDPTPFTCGRLAGELAGAVADRHAALDLSWGVLQRAGRACRSFAEWVDANHDRPRDCTAAALTVDDLERWQATLRTHYAGHSDMPGEIATSLFVTLRWLADQTETPVAPEIATRVRAPVSYPAPRRVSRRVLPEGPPRHRNCRSLGRRTAQAKPLAVSFEGWRPRRRTHDGPPRRPHARVARRPLWADSWPNCQLSSGQCWSSTASRCKRTPRPQLEAWQEISEAAARHGTRSQWR